MTELNTLGFYGKIPTNGDFVTRYLPRTFVEPWDQWLQESIATSQEQLGDQWLDCYLTGPIWRFALSKGVCSDNAWAGILMPSVDCVGRYFPLTTAFPINDSYPLLAIADNEEAWFSQAEHIALSALDQNNNLDSLTQKFENLGIPHNLRETPNSQQDGATNPGANPNPDFAGGDNWRIDMTESAAVSSSLSPLVERFLLERFPQCTLWWTSGSDQVEPSILICNKLPSQQHFSALLTGNWDDWGWNNILSSAPPKTNIDNENAAVSMT